MTDTNIKLIMQADMVLMDTQVISDLVSSYCADNDDVGALEDALGLCNDAMATLDKLKLTIEGVLSWT